ncbi:CHAD domain-containing protein [Thiomonas sp. FB-Cd]|uniref:CYTH and CHAD domain-containing protein n=1 Tax=Thiomonas sp. FB-Cd TaxID=1158292 RepID=UPI00068C11CA|nr:CHAD domain-containing protein [Thiomonas sp. FB-Cd]
MGVERELKFSIEAHTARQLLDHPILNLLAAPPVTQELATQYFDTPDARLAAAGLVLRLRRAAGQRVMTVKFTPLRGEGQGPADAFSHSRGEWEWEAAPATLEDAGEVHALADADLQRALHDTPLGSLGLELHELGRNLQPVFGTVFARTAWIVDWAGSQIELALDRGACTAVQAGQALSAPLAELEMELLSGQWAHCWDLAWAMAQDLALILSPVNKAQRAAALAAGKGVQALPEPPSLASATPVGQAAQLWVSTAAAQLAVWAELIGNSDTARAVHQFRVVLRRLRTVLRWLAPYADVRSVRWFAGELRWAMQIAGAVRDTDVWLDLLPVQTQTRLHVHIEARRMRLRAALQAYVRSPRFARLLLALGRWAEGWGRSQSDARTRGGAQRRAYRGQDAALAQMAKHAVRQDHRRWRKAWAASQDVLQLAVQGVQLTAKEAGKLHALRIQSKRLRLSLERLGHALPDAEAKELHHLRQKAEVLQTHLGDWHDAQRLLLEGSEQGWLGPDQAESLTARAVQSLAQASGAGKG